MSAAAARLAAWATALALFACWPAVAAADLPQTPTWAAVQESAKAAFALYDQESAATGTQKENLFLKRAEAFDFAFRQVAWYIRENFDESERASPSYAYSLFTMAHYLELSGDLWRARDYYVEVCMLIDRTLIPAGATIPTYNGATLQRLCNRQIQRLRSALNQLGRRPTRVSILQGIKGPTTADLVEHIKTRIGGRDSGLDTLVLASDHTPVYAYMAAVTEAEAAHGGRGTPDELAPRVIAQLAKGQGIETALERESDITVLGLGVSPVAAKALAESLARINATYQRVLPSGTFQPGPRTVIVSQAVPAEKWRFVSAALNDGTPRPEGAAFANKPLGALLLPPATPVAGRDTAAIDPVLYYVAYMRRYMDQLPSWLDPAMLTYDGAALHVLSNLDALIASVRAAGVNMSELPLYECPRTRAAARFCALHVGAFVRYLDSMADPSNPQRTLLQALAARVPELAGKSPVEQLAVLQQASGMAPEAMVQAFVAYRRASPWTREGDMAAVAAMAQVVARDFRMSRAP